MGSPLLDARPAGALGGVAADSRSLDQLRQLANRDPSKAVKQVATQFEALFMHMVLKSMREATPKSGLLDSSEQQMYASMLDEQLAQKIAAGGTGLGEVIARQLRRNLAPTAPAAAAGAAAPAGAPAARDKESAATVLQTIRAAAAVRVAK